MRASATRRRPVPRLLAASGTVLLCLVCAGSTGVAQDRRGAARASGELAHFSSDAELRAFLRKLRRRAENDDYGAVEEVIPSPPPPSPPPAGAPAVAGDEIELQQANVPEEMVRDSPGAQPSITNTQEKDVDEGGIVKISGDILVILRRGRLFTVSLAGGAMRAIDSIDAFPPGVDASGDWYDEMLLSGDRIVTVGYSYSRGGTEISRFRLGRDGRLAFEDAYHLRSNDYYSSRNYASRLIGDELIFYTPSYLEWEDDPFEALPGLRRWRGSRNDPFRRIARPRQVYIPQRLYDDPEAEIDAVHSVTRCRLTAPVLDCAATAVLGPSSRTFYVSSSAVWLWMSDAWSYDSERRGARGFLYRLPLDSEAPSAIATRGAPVDQFSFREDAADGVLNVLLRGEGGGDAMFDPEVSGGRVALLSLPIRDLGDGSEEIRRSHYRLLPGPERSWSFRNRFVGPYVLYGAGTFGRTPEEDAASLFAVPVRGGPASELKLPHGIDRIEALGRDALVVGSLASGLGFTAVELYPGAPRLGDRYVHPNSAEGETRSHAFFFSPDPGTPDGASGILGLPVARRADPAFHRFFGSAAAMVFLRRRERRFAPAGELEARPQGDLDDNCRASCVDWYGNARPIFLRPRTFALLGYELVEGRLEGERIREVARLDFTPRARRP